jgi:hypothetical protein
VAADTSSAVKMPDSYYFNTAAAFDAGAAVFVASRETPRLPPLKISIAAAAAAAVASREARALGSA